MPTIAQLPDAGRVTAQDEIPLSQAGATRAVTVGELLAGAQPAIVADTGTLLGRVSIGPGGPEQIGLGAGLGLSAGTLSANGGDHAGFARQDVLIPTDDAVLSSGSSPRLMPLGLLRGLFTAGDNITISGDGVIAAGSGSGPGLVGPQGPPGPAGADGAEGPPGPAGAAAPAIDAGVVNGQGILSLIRSDGATIAVAGAIVGATGPHGPPGAPGASIDTGAVTPDGFLSFVRSDGATIAVAGTIVGATGPQGPQGPAGAAGAAGPQGATGAAGPAINSGTVTPLGALSFVRSDGATVAVSGTIVGATGATGPQGPAGAIGATGATGPAGAAGPAINTGTVTPLGALSFVRSDGTTIAVSGTIVGATGATGPQGPAGAAGATGPQGATGAAGPAINTGTVTPLGALSFVRSDGTTIAVSGTIVGATGATGPQGPAGATGATGATGAAGPSINTGTVSPLGALSFVRSDGTTIAVSGTIVGATGATGPAGPTGPTGPAGSSITISGVPQVGTITASDLVGISQGGTDHSIALSTMLAGETGDQLAAAAPVSATDTFLTLQGGSTTLAQTASGIWAWIASSQLRTYFRPVIEMTGAPATVTLDGSIHNGCDIIVSGGPLTLNPSINLASGFECRVFNISGSPVSFGFNITTSTGVSQLPTGLACSIDVMTYSGGTLTFANIGGSTTTVTPPGQVTGLAAGTITSSSIALTWSAPGTGGTATSFTVNVAPHGSTSWTGISVTGTSATVTGLSASTAYDFQVIAVNAAGSGTPSATLASVSTIAAPTSAPGPVTSLAAGTATSTTMPLTWAAPSSGGAVASYTVNFRTTGSSTWTAFATGLSSSSPSATVTGLSASTGYDFQVVSVNGVGTGQATVSATTAAALAVPGQAGTPTASSIAATSLTLTWTAPTSGGTTASYTVQSSPHGAGTWTTVSGGSGVTALTLNVTGLTASTSYDFRVTAVNASGSGTPSASVNATTLASGGTYVLNAYSLPASGSSYPHGSGTIGMNINDGSSTSDGSHTAPTSVKFGLSSSNTVAPTGSALQAGSSFSNSGHNLWSVYYNPVTPGLAAGTYYVWAISYNGATQVASYTSTFTITLT